jgi:hypothetical protein
MSSHVSRVTSFFHASPICLFYEMIQKLHWSVFNNRNSLWTSYLELQHNSLKHRLSFQNHVFHFLFSFKIGRVRYKIPIDFPLVNETTSCHGNIQSLKTLGLYEHLLVYARTVCLLMLKFTAGKIFLSHSKTFSTDRKRQFNAFLTNVAWQLVIYMICWFLHFVTISERRWRLACGLFRTQLQRLYLWFSVRRY